MAAITTGSPAPLGVSLTEGGVNVAVYSKHATKIFFCRFDADEIDRIELTSRQGDVHFGFIPGVKPGQRYGLRADGPYDAARGQLFDISKLLVDPYAKQLDCAFSWHAELAVRGAETAHLVPKCIVIAPQASTGPLPPKTPRFIYEVAVKAFSNLHPLIPEAIRGTVAALAHPAAIAHFLKLGVDTIELMPLMAWADERHLARQDLSNAWGYNPIGFFAADPRLAPGGLDEIRKTVAALHDAGLRVILDVVYNHSGESDLGGPTIGFRGLDNTSYYAQADGVLVNDTGCGNTLATDHQPVIDLILDSMRHWVNATGLDGFRYDLATVMGRSAQGFDPNSPLLKSIQQDALLGSLIHIAEPWDVGPGGYQLGNFPPYWGEWNDRYRDDVRHFWRGDTWAAGNLATRLAGSSDIFALGNRKPSSSINFVAAHDGFTLRDAVTFDHKNNFANGEENRDGNANEPCWISGNPQQDVKALLATLFVSRGTVMLTAGDEFGRSQRGNNNAYAQDNATTWLDWSKADAALIGHVAALARFRAEHAGFFADRFLTGHTAPGETYPDIQWLSGNGGALDWSDPALPVLGMLLSCPEASGRLLVWFNRSSASVEIALPDSQAGFTWGRDSLTCEGRSVTCLLEVPDVKRMSSRPADGIIHELATAAGIQGEWWEVNGTGHQVSIETKRALLEAMALPVATLSEARAAFRKLAETPPMPQFTVAVPDRAFSIAVAASARSVAFTLHSAGGKAQTLLLPAGETRLNLPPLAVGRYELHSDTRPELPCRVAVTSRRCYQPPSLQNGKRLYGLTSHLYALRHDHDGGIGDFETLARFCEASAGLGGSLAGINPLHHMFTDDRTRVSPYQPSDRRFIDPIYIDIADLEKKLGATQQLKKLQAELSRLRTMTHVDYGGVWRAKDDILGSMFKKFEMNEDFESFIAKGGAALRDHARFEARHDPKRYAYAMWLQWIADGQLSAAAERGRAAGLELGIYRDLALGCAYEGGEVWARPELYATAVSLGSPPDPFSRDGQVWNLPPFNPLTLADAGYEPFCEVLRANMRHAKVLRIDHILGLARQFWVPRGASGSDGAYVGMPQENLLALTALESELAGCAVIGEDLGTVPDGLRDSLSAAKILSYRVLWFEQDERQFYPPHTYPHEAAACLSSHDLAPFKGWRETATQADVAKLERAVAEAGVNTGDLLADAHAFVAQTPCSIMLVQADDLSEEVEPLNVPGTDQERPNWRRRLSVMVDSLQELATSQNVVAAIQRTGRRKK